MNQSVVIKAHNGGIVVVLDKDMDFEELKAEIASKFAASAKFFNHAQMALRLEGRELSEEEKREIVDIISENSDLQIVCIVEEDPEMDLMFADRMKKLVADMAPQRTIQQKTAQPAATVPTLPGNYGQFYVGNLRSGQVLEVDTGIVVIGDVNPGAEVIAQGNIVILGTLKGNAFAGASGNEKAFVIALDMMPVQIRIADVIARSPDKPVKAAAKETKIAFVEDGNIYMEPLTNNVVSEIHLNA